MASFLFFVVVRVWLGFRFYIYFLFLFCCPYFRQPVNASASVYFQAVTWTPFSSYMWLVRRWQRRRLESCCCCSGAVWREGGRVAIKPRSPTLRVSLWRKKADGEGVRERGIKGPSNPLYLPTTGVCFPTLYCPSTRTQKKTSLYLD